MKNIILVWLSVFSIGAVAQVLDEDVAVLKKLDGDKIFKLKQGEEVFTYTPNDGWYKIRKEAYVNASSFVDEDILPENTRLNNKAGDSIGVTLEEIRVKDFMKLKAFRGEDRYSVILEGYLFKTKLDDETIPEIRLNNILASKNRAQQQTNFEDFFTAQKFEDRKFGEFTAYVLYERNKTTSPEKDFRLIVIYRGSSLFATIANDHLVKAPKIKDEVFIDQFQFQYFYKPTSSQKQVIEDEILYTFLAL